jgi:hypothetical protein
MALIIPASLYLVLSERKPKPQTPPVVPPDVPMR